jgi:hypothetical protein
MESIMRPMEMPVQKRGIHMKTYVNFTVFDQSEMKREIKAF